MNKKALVGPVSSFFVAIAIGVCTGIGAAAFRGTIGIFHNLFFNGTFSLHYDASIHTALTHWAAAIILIPVIGSVLVTFLVTRFAPEAKGHGVPEVIDAVYYKKGIIRPHVVWIKALASSISIGSGGSVGREGPIIQIGSAFGSWIGQIFKVPPWERITWLACGAGGGIAATFNTPIGGILFATEIILQEVSV
jgi:CIC family chloride channel protein